MVSQAVCKIVAASSNQNLKMIFSKLALSKPVGAGCAGRSDCIQTEQFTQALRSHCDLVHNNLSQKKILSELEVQNKRARKVQEKKIREERKILEKREKENQKRARADERLKVATVRFRALGTF